jgi:hypothetical protein
MSDVASSIHENGIVFLHIPSGQIFASNIIGARIWCGLREGQSMEMIVSDIGNDYQVDSTTIRGHVEAFVSELERQKFIQREMPS